MLRRIAPWLLLAALGLCLLGTAVPGAFSIDESSYVASLRALRAGTIIVPGTDAVSPSPELHSFDPDPPRTPSAAQVVPVVPPLYAYFAWPFAALGWLGLVALNVLSFLGCAVVVYFLARRVSGDGRAANLATLLYLFGSYGIEYAQAVWPHMLSVFLCTAAFALTSKWRDEGGTWLVFAAGMATGLASGVRYQNIVLASALGLTVVLFGRPRLWGGACYALGLALPLLGSSVINHARQGSWNPVSKAHPGYMTLSGGGPAARGSLLDLVLDTLHAFYAKVVDFSVHPPIGSLEPGAWHWAVDPDVGMFIAFGAVKKALLQSAPWMTVALLTAAGVWSRRGLFAAHEPRELRELRAISVVLFSVLLLFALAGMQRHDGICFNQRYFLELLPLGAVAAAAYLAPLRARSVHWLVGAVLGALLAGAVLVAMPGSWWRSQGLRLAPLFLVLLLLVSMITRSARGLRAELGLVVLASASASYALCVHLGDDLVASRSQRAVNAAMAARWAAVLPDHSALFVYWGNKDAAAPLHLDRDLLVVDPWIDSGRDAARLVDELLAAHRRVFVDLAYMPSPMFVALRGEHALRAATSDAKPMVELLPLTAAVP